MDDFWNLLIKLRMDYDESKAQAQNYHLTSLMVKKFLKKMDSIIQIKNVKFRKESTWFMVKNNFNGKFRRFQVRKPNLTCLR